MSRESGAAAVVSVALTGVLVTVTLLAAALGGLLVGHRRVSAAADLAALAGAGAIQRGASACPAADEVARANHARLRSCRVSGEEVLVVATRSVPLMGRTVRLAATARAGPAGQGRPGLGPLGS